MRPTDVVRIPRNLPDVIEQVMSRKFQQQVIEQTRIHTVPQFLREKVLPPGVEPFEDKPSNV
jgi:hypothetical protein